MDTMCRTLWTLICPRKSSKDVAIPRLGIRAVQPAFHNVFPPTLHRMLLQVRSRRMIRGLGPIGVGLKADDALLGGLAAGWGCALEELEFATRVVHAVLDIVAEKLVHTRRPASLRIVCGLNVNKNFLGYLKTRLQDHPSPAMRLMQPSTRRIYCLQDAERRELVNGAVNVPFRLTELAIDLATLLTLRSTFLLAALRRETEIEDEDVEDGMKIELRCIRTGF
jgi:hypothetical protein